MIADLVDPLLQLVRRVEAAKRAPTDRDDLTNRGDHRHDARITFSPMAGAEPCLLRCDVGTREVVELNAKFEVLLATLLHPSLKVVALQRERVERILKHLDALP